MGSEAKGTQTQRRVLVPTLCWSVVVVVVFFFFFEDVVVYSFPVVFVVFVVVHICYFNY